FIHSCGGTEDLGKSTPYVETATTSDPAEAAAKVLTGAVALAAEGREDVILIYPRRFPARSIEEPDNEKSLRGPRDGFCEQLVQNTALIRRRIKDPALTAELITLGRDTKTDAALVYLSGKADRKLIDAVRERMRGYPFSTLSFGEQTLAEYLVRSRWYNPFPKVRYTERPDSASAMVLEGSVIILVDNSPSAIILPTSIFDFLQESNDFYLPPVTGTYLRITRLIMALLTVFFIPVWYYVIHTDGLLPDTLSFIKVSKEGSIPVYWQLILVEFIIDGLKIASLNTPNSLGNSLSVVMGLILGDLAVEIGWFIPEVILYMAFIAIANFAQPSYELGYALKYMRIMLLTLTAVIGLWGLIGGTVVLCLLIVSNKTVDGSRSYLYPLIPWNGRSMKRFFLRARLKK
ncbi:MAG: spore germination protein, partial [Clostridia bacterium]|nr:spore germination protein [Clostridia bacterium]